jgi:hypothetical protein
MISALLTAIRAVRLRLKALTRDTDLPNLGILTGTGAEARTTSGAAARLLLFIAHLCSR